MSEDDEEEYPEEEGYGEYPEDEYSQPSYACSTFQHLYAFGPREPPKVTELVCDHLGYSRLEIIESDGDVEAQCEDQDHCDLFEKKGCPVTSWVEYNQGICEDCGETGDDCKCD